MDKVTRSQAKEPAKPPEAGRERRFSSLEPGGRGAPCPHLDFRLLVFRTRRKQFSVV